MNNNRMSMVPVVEQPEKKEFLSSRDPFRGSMGIQRVLEERLLELGIVKDPMDFIDRVSAIGEAEKYSCHGEVLRQLYWIVFDNNRGAGNNMNCSGALDTKPVIIGRMDGDNYADPVEFAAMARDVLNGWEPVPTRVESVNVCSGDYEEGVYKGGWGEVLAKVELKVQLIADVLGEPVQMKHRDELVTKDPQTSEGVSAKPRNLRAFFGDEPPEDLSEAARIVGEVWGKLNRVERIAMLEGTMVRNRLCQFDVGRANADPDLIKAILVEVFGSDQSPYDFEKGSFAGMPPAGSVDGDGVDGTIEGVRDELRSAE